MSTTHLRDIERLARDLIRQHAPDGWTFAWDSARRRAGACHHNTRRITLARDVLANWQMDDCRDTILHEIAHANAGPRAGHGYRWAAECKALGIEPERCWEPSATQPLPPARYVGTCPAGHETKRDRKPATRSSCAKCAPYRFDANHLINWERA